MELHLTVTVSLAIWDQFYLLHDTSEHTALTPARQAGTQYTYPGGMQGWVDLGGGLHTEMAYLTLTLSSNRAQCTATALIEC